MASVVIDNTDIELGIAADVGTNILVGDYMEISTPSTHRGLWRVVRREHRLIGTRCELALICVDPADKVAAEIARAERV